MAKALLGHVGFAPDHRIVAELQRLRATVRRLQADNDRLLAANAALAEQVHDLQLHSEMLTLSAERQLDVDEPIAHAALTRA
jgi:cell division protein FtsB